MLRAEHLENEDTQVEKDRPYEIAVHVCGETLVRYIRRYLHNKHYLTLIDQFTPSPEERHNGPAHVKVYSESMSFEQFFGERGYTIKPDTEDLATWKALAISFLNLLSLFVPAALDPTTVVAADFLNLSLSRAGRQPTRRLKYRRMKDALSQAIQL